MNNHDNKHERVIDLKDLLFRILYGWRKILLVAIIFTILMGSYKFYSGNKTLNNKSILENQEIAYKSALATYETSKKTLEKEITNLQTSIERQNEYNEKSILMQINPFDKQVATINYYIDTNYKISPNLTFQNIDTTDMVIKAYITNAQNGEIYNYIIDNLSYDIDLKYFKEIFLAEADFENNMIKIEISHFNKDICSEILDLITKYFEIEKAEIQKIIGEHELSIVNESIQSVVDLDLELKQKEKLQLATSYKDNLIEKQKSFSSLAAPVRTSYSKTLLIKSAIKYSVLGFAFGAFLQILIILLSYAFSNKVIKEKEISQIYNLKVLGVIDKPSKKSVLKIVDRWISRLEGTLYNKIDENAAIKRIVANIEAILKLGNLSSYNIVITGTTDINKIEYIYKKIDDEIKSPSYKLSYGDNINYTAKTIKQVSDSNVVIIVEELEKSSFSEINKELENIYVLDKNVLGVIII